MQKLIFTIFIFLFCSCGRDVKNPYVQPNGKKKILSSTAMINSLVGFIGGEEVDHLSLIQGNIDPHNYELVKGDGEKICSADVIFFNGLGLEHGASITQQFALHPYAVSLGEAIFKKNQDRFIYINGQIDPHIWMDITLFSEVIDPIVEALKTVDPVNADLFMIRGEDLKKKMLAKDQKLCVLMQTIPEERRFLVTSHDAFHYFTKRYLSSPKEIDWNKRLIAPEGISPDGQLGLEDIKKVIDFVYKNDVRVVFPESNLNQDPLKKIVAICRKKGLYVSIASESLYGDTMGEKGDNIESYLEMVEHNVRAIIENLNQDYGNRSKPTHSQL